MADKGNLYVIAAPSGTGKTSLVKALAESLPDVLISASHTTRTKRPNEQHGVNYFFVSREEFGQLILKNEFLEHAIVFEHHYGTLRRWVEKTLAAGKDVILEIDWQGHQQIKQQLPKTVSIFILPPSLPALRERLLSRNQDKPEIIAKRLADVRETVSHIQEFDYLVINDLFEQAVQDLAAIIRSHRLGEPRQSVRFSSLIQHLETLSVD